MLMQGTRTTQQINLKKKEMAAQMMVMLVRQMPVRLMRKSRRVMMPTLQKETARQKLGRLGSRP